MSKEFVIERSKKGFPALWECGGGYSNTGGAQIIAGKNGEAKQPSEICDMFRQALRLTKKGILTIKEWERLLIYIRRGGEPACWEHALIPISVGDYVISASHHRGDFEIFVYRITEILKEEASTEKIAEFSNGEWDAELPAFLEAAVQAAMQKATCYHCRAPHFIKSRKLSET